MSTRPLFVVAGVGNSFGACLCRCTITLIDLLQAQEALLRTYHRAFNSFISTEADTLVVSLLSLDTTSL